MRDKNCLKKITVVYISLYETEASRYKFVERNMASLTSYCDFIFSVVGLLKVGKLIATGLFHKIK